VGASINGVGNLNVFNPNNEVAGAQGQGRARFNPLERRGSDSPSHANPAPEAVSGTDTGTVYQVPAGVALQAQLQGVPGATSPAHTNAAGTQRAPSAAASGGAEQPSTANGGATTAAPTGTSPTVRAEENQLYTTLQSLGLSPAAIEQFMNTADLLAEVSPGLFQAFENAVESIVQTPQATGPASGLVSPAGATTAAPTGNTTSTPNSQVEFASVQVSEAEVTLTPGSSGKQASTSNKTPNPQAEFASVQVSEADVALTAASPGKQASTSNNTPNSQVEFAAVEVSEAEVQITPASSGQGSVANVAAVSFVATLQAGQAASQTSAASAPSQSSSTTGSATPAASSASQSSPASGSATSSTAKVIPSQNGSEPS
jgi:hypothetical protein